MQNFRFGAQFFQVIAWSTFWRHHIFFLFAYYLIANAALRAVSTFETFLLLDLQCERLKKLTDSNSRLAGGTQVRILIEMYQGMSGSHFGAGRRSHSWAKWPPFRAPHNCKSCLLPKTHPSHCWANQPKIRAPHNCKSRRLR